MNSSWPANKLKPHHWVSWAVVDQKWKLVASKNLGYIELYDILNDPFETNDLKEKEPEIVKSLLKQLTQWQTTLPSKPSGNVFSAERLK